MARPLTPRMSARQAVSLMFACSKVFWTRRVCWAISRTSCLRDLTRTRKQLVREIAQHTLRVQKTLEHANIKLTACLADILGVSGRAILQALVAGERDPERLADLAS